MFSLKRSYRSLRRRKVDVHQVHGYLRQEKVPNMAPAAIPTATPIMKPILTRSKQLGWAWPYGPTATGIWAGGGTEMTLRDYGMF